MRSDQAKKPKKPEERNSQLIRLIELISYLDQLGARDIYEIAEHFGRNPKTIQRDFDALEAAGIPLVSEPRGKRKAWRIDFKGALAKLSSLLDAGHFLALRVAMEPGAAISASSPVFAALEDLGQKIEQAIGSAGKEQLAAIDAAFYAYEKRAYKEAPPDVLWPLVHAIGDRKLCRVTYRAPSDEPTDKTYDVLPLKLFAYDGALYLMCHAPQFGYQMKLNLQRLRSLKVLNRRGRVPRDFDPEALENAAFGLVVGGPLTTYRLRFNKFMAPFIRERIWHPSQTLRELPDHGVELEFRCTASYEVDAWVQRWGDGVEVLAPESLRKKQRELGQWLIDKYRRPVRRPRGRGHGARVVR